MQAKTKPATANPQGSKTPTVQQIARFFNAPEANVRMQFAKNAKQLFQMASEAKAAGRKINGFTELELRKMSGQQLAQCVS